MSIAVAPLKIKGAIRQEAIKHVQAQIQSVVLSALGSLIMAFLEAEVEAVLGRPKSAPRTVASISNGEWAASATQCAIKLKPRCASR